MYILIIHCIKSCCSFIEVSYVAKFTQVLSVPNQNKTPSRMNLEQTRKSSLRSHGISVVPFPHLEFMKDCSLPCYIGMREPPLAEAVIMSSANSSLWVTSTLQMSVIHPQTSICIRSLSEPPPCLTRIFCMEYFLCFFNPRTELLC